MTTDQTTLMQGKVLEKYRATLHLCIDDALLEIRKAFIAGGPCEEEHLDLLMAEVRSLVHELQHLPLNDDVPF